MRLIYGADEFVSAWVAQRLGVSFRDAKAIGVERDGKLIAGVVYHDYRPSYASIQMSVAAIDKSRWLSKGNLAAFFYYPFVQLKCSSVYVCCSRKARRTRKFVEKVGFKYSGLLRRGFGTVDAVLYDMLSTEVRWLKDSTDERQPLHAARA